MSDRSPYDLSNGPRLWDPARPARHDKTSEELRRLARYDKAIELLRECSEYTGKSDLPGLDWVDCQIDRESLAEALAFLAEEPTP